MPLISAGKTARPAWWGFFISAGILALLFLGETLWLSHIEGGWDSLKKRTERDIADVVQSEFAERVSEQLDVSQMILRDQRIGRAISDGSASSLSGAFQVLEDYGSQDNVSIDIVDSTGRVVAWAGRSVMKSFETSLHRVPSDTILLVSQASLHLYLSTGLAMPGRRYHVFVSQPLETNFPISNRFVSQESFADGLSQRLALPVHFVTEVSARDTAGEVSFAVPLRSKKGSAIVTAIIPVPTMAMELQNVDRGFDSAKSFFAALCMSLIVIVVAGIRKLRGKSSLRDGTLILLIWLLRIGWKSVGFPSLLVGGFLFDPAVEASPFPLGLAGTLGELLLSTLTLAVTIFLFLRIVVSAFRSRSQGPRRGSFGPTVGRYALGALSVFALQWIVRGYGAALRSFVFDSTIQYEDPFSLVPNFPMAVMHLSILCLTAALLGACFLVFVVVSRCLGGLVRDGRLSGTRLLIFSSGLLAAYAAYLWLDQPPQLPVYLPLVAYALVVVYLVMWESGKWAAESWKARPLMMTSVVIGASFVIAILGLDAKTHEKEHERVQILADELLRPVDNWLSLIMSESLHGASARASVGLPGAANDSTASEDLAFTLWAQTLLSKEGYNSALVVYDSDGKELSRFSVGLTSFEQFQLLSQVFHKEEEALLVVDRKVADGTIKYYGEWGSVLGADGQPLGTIAVLMSASQRTLFRGEAPEQLRTGSREQLQEVFRRMLVSEYRGGVLWSTNDPALFRGMKLSEEVESQLENSPGRFVWSKGIVEGSSEDVLYARDDADHSRVLSLSLTSLDIRWHIFNLVKTLLVYLGFLALAALALGAKSLNAGKALRFGFREKLVTSFAILSILPLILMAYFNRELAIDRLDENITRRLSQDLDVVQQRFSSAIVEEQDFSQGVHNDFCEAVASDLGVDFSVYQGDELKASSRPELYRSSILDDRLTGTAYVNIMVLGRGFYKTRERVGEVSYIVGYRPLVVGDSIRGVLAVPALYRQQEIDEELAQRNAFVLGAYAFVVSLVIALGVFLANTLSRPLRDLSKAARSVGKGDLDIVLQSPSTDEVGDLIRSFNEMTTELKTSRVSLARAERELAWKEMAKQVAHEIKNPLTPIKLSIQHLVQAYRQGARDFGEILQRVSDTVVEQIEVLTRIASEFSNFARMPERQFERVELNQLLGETINLFKEVEGIEIKSNLSDSPAIVIADRDELRRVFINLLRNSVQAMEGGGIISIFVRTEREICTIRVSDTGRGISPDIQSKVFQPNFSTKTDGMGLGLAIAQKVIEDLNGTIRLESGIGRGTTVEMRIPLRYS